MTTSPYISRHVVAALKKAGHKAYTSRGTPGFKVSSFHGGPAHVQCYGARTTPVRRDCLAAYRAILDEAGFTCIERDQHFFDVIQVP